MVDASSPPSMADAGDPSDPCGGCLNTDICVVLTFPGAPCEVPGPSGACPAGTSLTETNCCQSDAPVQGTCMPGPSACAADFDLSCDCAGDFCSTSVCAGGGGVCESGSGDTLYCACNSR